MELPDERMGDLDAVVWAVEHEPRFRTTIGALARLAGPIDVTELHHRVERASRAVPRLRQRVVHDPLGIAPPRWSVDPDFRLSFHLRRARLSRGDDATLLRVVRDLVVQPFDRSRPLWEFTLLEGLDDGGVALLLKGHHAVSDGVGGVEMILELFDLEPEAGPERRTLPPSPVPAAGHEHPVAASLRHESARTVEALRRGIDALAATRSLDDVSRRAKAIGASLGAAARLVRPSPGAAPVVAPARSAGLDLRTFDVALDDLRDAGRRVGGTVNDAFVAGVLLGIADHHGHRSGTLRMSIPMNARPTSGGGTGNHWIPGRIDVAIHPDPDTVMGRVGAAVRRLRDEPLDAVLGPVTAGVRRLPAAAAAGAFGAVAGAIDVAASNVPGSPIPLHLCGEEVVSLVPFGPLSGTAVNVTLLSHAGTAHMGVASDPAAIADPDGLARDLEHAFLAVVKGS